MKRILTTTLIIRFSSVGDIILTSPLIRTLRARFPQCRIDFLVKEEYADLVRHNPYLSQTLLFPSGGTSADLRRFRTTIQTSRYDLILDMHDSIRSRVLCCGSTPVLRYRKRRLARFTLIHGKLDVYRSGSPSVAARYLEPVQAIGVDDDGRGTELFVPDTMHSSVEKVLSASGIARTAQMIGLCPSARHATKMWLPERFAGTAATLARTYGLPVLLFGSAAERDRCDVIAAQIRTLAPDKPVLNCAGTFSLLETAAAMDRCMLVITNDTGLMHMASARKRPVVALFGPTVRQFGFAPEGPASRVVEVAGLSCRPCTAIGRATCPRGHFRCMQDIREPEVVAAARELLDRN
jgi:heptosyltransferase-2